MVGICGVFNKRIVCFYVFFYALDGDLDVPSSDFGQ